MNYVQYGKSTKSKKGKKSTQSGAGANSQRSYRGHGMSSKPSGRVRSFHSHKTLATDVGKADTKRYRTAKLWTWCAEDVERKDTLRSVCLKGKHSMHSLEVPQASTSTAGAGASEPLYFNDEGQPVYTYMVSVPHVNKHLIKFPIALDYLTLRGRNKMENSTSSTGHSDCSTMLLKADTGADVNLMNRKHLINSLERPKECFN